jgi:diadenosine tetraphosphatase ApaH/serine/threonine PP2A family protein phosphatase
VDSFAPDADGEDERLLAGVHDQVVVFGHSHVQFGRPGLNGTELVNPGSVGMPLDGDVRAAWALRRDQGEFEFRRTKYDVERAVAKARELGDWADQIVTRLERGSD